MFSEANWACCPEPLYNVFWNISCTQNHIWLMTRITCMLYFKFTAGVDTIGHIQLVCISFRTSVYVKKTIVWRKQLVLDKQTSRPCLSYHTHCFPRAEKTLWYYYCRVVSLVHAGNLWCWVRILICHDYVSRLVIIGENADEKHTLPDTPGGTLLIQCDTIITHDSMVMQFHYTPCWCKHGTVSNESWQVTLCHSLYYPGYQCLG